MSEERLPLQLLSAEVIGWARGGRGMDTTYFRNSHRVARALRRFGIPRDLWWDAAQDAGRWRARLRREADAVVDCDAMLEGDGGHLSAHVNAHMTNPLTAPLLAYAQPSWPAAMPMQAPRHIGLQP